MIKYTRYLGIISRIFMNVLLLFYVFLLPYLADFYLLDPQIPFQDFYFKYIGNRYYIFEIIIISLAIISILCITGRVGVSMIVTGLPVMLLTYASSIKFAARNELLHLDDLKLTEAAGMAVNFLDFRYSPARVKAIVTVAIFCICGIMADILYRKFALPVKANRKLSIQIPRVVRWVMSGICIIAMFVYSSVFMRSTENVMRMENGQLVNEGYDQFVLYNFFKNEKNIDITSDDIEKSYDFFLGKSKSVKFNLDSGKRPTVIVIMNESWWNLDNRIGENVIFSKDPMQPFHELSEICSSGYLSTNIYGGGTISSETEFLTGINTKYLLSDVGVYVETRSHKIPSIVDYFHALNYHTIAIHPYYGSFYSRDQIYAQMGFDKVIFEDGMDYTDIYTRYISDESLAHQIIKEYEEKESSEKGEFIFAVSIANHDRSLYYKYDVVEDYPYPIEVTVKSEALSEAERSDLVNTVNGIYLANKAFAQLTAYFEEKKEPVLIVMYGDHIPFFSGSVLNALGVEGNDYECQRRQYSVPVLMWSNFNDNKIEFTGENINYLPQMLLEYAGMPESDMTQILQCEKNCFKTDIRRFIEDSAGEQIKVYNNEQLEVVRHINVVGYDILFGDSFYREKLWLPYGAGE